MSQPPPTFADLASLVRMLHQPAPAPAPEERGMLKQASGVINALAVALLVWVGTSVTGQATTQARALEKLDGIVKSIDEFRSALKAQSDATTDIRTQASRDSQRITANEQAIGRLSERMRIVEGDRPLPRTGP